MNKTKCPACSDTGLSHGGPATPPCQVCDEIGINIKIDPDVPETEIRFVDPVAIRIAGKIINIGLDKRTYEP